MRAVGPPSASAGVGHEGYSSGNGLLAATVLGKIAGDAASAELIRMDALTP